MLRNILRGIFVILVGCGLLIWPKDSTEIILKVLGGIFLAGGASIVIYLLTTHASTNFKGITILNIASAVGFLLLGFLLLLRTEFFKDFIAYIFGAILIIYGVIQIVRTYRFNKDGSAKATLYIVPVLITLIGIIFFLKLINPLNLFAVIFGVSLIFLGLSELMINNQLRKVNKALRDEAEKAAEKIHDAEVEDVEATEVEDASGNEPKDNSTEENEETEGGD